MLFLLRYLLCKQPDKLLLDGRGRGARDLLAHDAAGQRAEGVDHLGQAFGGEDPAVVLRDDGLQARLYCQQVRACFLQEVAGGRRGARDAALGGRDVDAARGVGGQAGAAGGFEGSVGDVGLGGAGGGRGVVVGVKGGLGQETYEGGGGRCGRRAGEAGSFGWGSGRCVIGWEAVWAVKELFGDIFFGRWCCWFRTLERLARGLDGGWLWSMCIAIPGRRTTTGGTSSNASGEHVDNECTSSTRRCDTERNPHGDVTFRVGSSFQTLLVCGTDFKVTQRLVRTERHPSAVSSLEVTLFDAGHKDIVTSKI